MSDLLNLSMLLKSWTWCDPGFLPLPIISFVGHDFLSWVVNCCFLQTCSIITSQLLPWRTKLYVCRTQIPQLDMSQEGTPYRTLPAENDSRHRWTGRTTRHRVWPIRFSRSNVSALFATKLLAVQGIDWLSQHYRSYQTLQESAEIGLTVDFGYAVVFHWAIQMSSWGFLPQDQDVSWKLWKQSLIGPVAGVERSLPGSRSICQIRSGSTKWFVICQLEWFQMQLPWFRQVTCAKVNYNALT